MSFDLSKRQMLEKLYLPDKSKKGNVDKPLIPLIDLINEQDDYYTTSSCSGRICIFTDHDSEIKSGAEWLFVSHDLVKFEELKTALEKLPESLTSFRVEGMILHVACRTLEDATKFMIFCQNNGYKHTGVIASTKRYIVQVLGVERFDAPISIKKELLVSEDYIRFVLEQANIKLKKTHDLINKLYSKFKEEF